MQLFPVHKVYDSEKQKWSKRPAIPRGQDWHTVVCTAEQLSRAENLGAVIPAGRVVIDLDTYKGVTRAMVDAALGVALDWDGAQLQTTVGGGEHYCFELPAGAEARQGDSLLGVQGFDTRAAGKGWICTGDGYQNLSMLGMPEALYLEPFPQIPMAALAALNSNFTATPSAPSAIGEMEISEVDVRDLELAINHQRLDGLTLEDLTAYVTKLPATDLEGYSSWLKVGMALHHQTDGKKEGFLIWDRWSKDSSHYDYQECRDKWRSFANRSSISKPTRFDYIISRAGGRAVVDTAGAAAALVTTLDDLLARAASIDTLEDYTEFKREVRAIAPHALPLDGRRMIAKELHDAFGKAKGLGITDIRNELLPKKRSVGGAGAVVDPDGNSVLPEWAAPWVYVEITCEFAHTELHYAIRREAFNAKYDRLPDVLLADKPASAYCLVDLNMQTVVDKIFWPGGGRILEVEGKQMLNTYHPSGVTPCAAEDMSVEGQAAIDLMLAHVDFTIADPREREILLDFLTYVYQNPGKRVGWALMLQGSQGTGKSFFAVMMQHMMGTAVTNLEPSAIEGRFTGWAHGSTLIVIEEIRISGTSKFTVLDRMKPFISNATVVIEEKGRDHRTVPNFSSYLLFTNHRDAIPIGDGDRRYCAIFGRVQSEEQLYAELGGESGAATYFDKLFTAVQHHADALAYYFSSRAVSGNFHAKGRAPETGARREMISYALSPDRLALEDAISRHTCAVINDQLVDVTWLNRLATAEGDLLPTGTGLSRILLEMGYEAISGRRMRIKKTGTKHYVWIKVGLKQPDVVKELVRQFHDSDESLPF
jgi:hypothetical protein